MDLAKMARDAELTDPDLGPFMTDYGYSEQAIRAFAAAVLEEAAKVCDAQCAEAVRKLKDTLK